jgi:anti-sigma B factor antagonist
MELDLSTADLGGGVGKVVVAGEVDLYTAPALKRSIRETIDQGTRYLLVDLSSATFIDSTTLGVLIGAVKRLRPMGGELAIACSDPNIRKIFAITLLDRIFEIFETADEAVDHLRAAGAVETAAG